MNRASKLTAWGCAAALSATAASPVLADKQSDKNNMRNLAIAGAAVAGYGLLNHNNTATLLGIAGAALAGSQYEKDRKQQSEDNNRRRYYYRGETWRGQDWRGQDWRAPQYNRQYNNYNNGRYYSDAAYDNRWQDNSRRDNCANGSHKHHDRNQSRRDWDNDRR